MAGPFPWLAAGALTGTLVGLALAPALGLRRAVALQVLAFAGIWALLGGHLAAVLLYHRPALATVGPGLLLDLANGQAAMGMLLSGALGAWLHGRLARVPAAPHLDLVAMAAAPAGVVGRVGCYLAGDHPGAGEADPALLEALVWLAILAVLLRALRHHRPPGALAVLAALLYGTGRFACDFLRLTPEEAAPLVAAGRLDPALVDPRWLGLTPAQWLALGLVTAAAAGLRRLRRPVPGSDGPAGEA